jgi:predicted RNA-binding protein YlqC (UPF0109 family)
MELHRLTIPTEAAGLLIGRQGSAIRAMSEESGARVSISASDAADALTTQERVVSISGRAAACINCAALLLAKLAEEPNNARYAHPGSKYPRSSSPSASASASASASDRRPAGRRVHSSASSAPTASYRRGLSSSSSSTSVANPLAVLSATTTLQVSVPESAIGSVLGRHGAVLKDIQALSGAEVSVSSRGDRGGVRVVTIVGSPAAAQTAQTLIAHKVLEAGM